MLLCHKNGYQGLDRCQGLYYREMTPHADVSTSMKGASAVGHLTGRTDLGQSLRKTTRVCLPSIPRHGLQGLLNATPPVMAARGRGRSTVVSGVGTDPLGGGGNAAND
jgi:hypothetical protein